MNETNTGRHYSIDTQGVESRLRTDNARLHAENAKLREALEPLLAGAVEEYMLSLPANLKTKHGQLMRRLIRDAAVALNMTPRKNRGAEPSPAAAERATSHASATEGGSAA